MFLLFCFLGLLFLCRATKEGFEPMGPGGVLLEPMKEGETAETEEEEEVEEPSPPPPPPPPVLKSTRKQQPDSGMTVYGIRKGFLLYQMLLTLEAFLNFNKLNTSIVFFLREIC